MKIENIAQLAIQALIEEVMVNPKPGLVDPVTHGAHPDMDAFTFVSSALALQPYFQQIVILAQNFNQKDLRLLFQQIRIAGIEAEKVMFATTRGVNTHKGAIFSLGIMVTATAYELSHHPTLTLEAIQKTIQQMLWHLTEHDFAKVKEKLPETLTAGEREYLRYGMTGIRGQAQAGFPVVFDRALPFLRATTSTNRNAQLVDTLMVIVQHTADSNLVKRANQQKIIPWVVKQARTYFKLGASLTRAGRLFLQELDQIFTRKHLSLGGSADLLILTIFLALSFGWL